MTRIYSLATPHLRFVVGPLLLAAVFTVDAQTKKPVTSWPQEPTTFLGLKFNVSLESQLPACGTAEVNASHAMCYRKPLSHRTVLENLPDLGVPITSAAVLSFVGKPGIVSVEVPQAASHFMLQALENRYGPPHQTVLLDIKPANPTSNRATSYRWKGPRIEISFSTDAGGYIEGAMLTVSSREVLKAAGDVYDADTRKAAQKL